MGLSKAELPNIDPDADTPTAIDAQSNKYIGLIDVAPVLFNAALVSRLNSLDVAGAPMDFNNLTMKTMVRYMKSHEGIRRVSEGLKAAGQPSP